MATDAAAAAAAVNDIFGGDSSSDEDVIRSGGRAQAHTHARAADDASDSDAGVTRVAPRPAAAARPTNDGSASSDDDGPVTTGTKKLGRLRAGGASSTHTQSKDASSPAASPPAKARARKAAAGSDDSGANTGDDSDASGASSSGASSAGSASSGSPHFGAGRRKKKLPKRNVPARPVREPRKKRAEDEPAKEKRRKDGEESDEYASEHDEGPNAEDDAFIDRDDDDAELLAEYAKDKQDFRDDRAGVKRRRGHAGEESEEEERVDSRAAGKDAGKGSKKKKGLSDEDKIALVSGLIRDMQLAARADRKDRSEGKPALHKLKMLDRVRKTVAIAELHQMLLEGVARGASADYDERNNPTILSVLRDWLRPLAGADLPAVQIREAVYDALERLPVNVDDLGSSRIGEVLFALSQHPGETQRNRDKLMQMIERFSRSIFDKSDSYRGGISQMLERQQELGLVSATGRRAAAAATAAPAAIDPTNISDADLGRLLGDDLEALARGDGADKAGARPGERVSRHARMAAPVVFDYVVKHDRAGTVATVDGATGSFAISKPSKESANAIISKRLMDLRRSKGKSAEKPMKLSIEGRGSNV